MPLSGESSSPRPLGVREAAFYALAVVAAIGIFLAIRAVGQRNEPADVAMGLATGPTSASLNTLFHLLLALAVIILTTRLVGMLFQLIDQPLVIGELVGGIILGPSLLGRIAPEVSRTLFAPEIIPLLGVHAQLGVILYMFLVGLELDWAVIRHQGRATIAISHASIIVPFLLGSALALLLYPQDAGSPVSFTVFALFIGVSLSVTAFP